MDNLKNKKFIEFKKNNSEKIKYWLRRDMINDLIIKEYISIEKNNAIYTIHQLNFDFYYGHELDDLKNTKSQYSKILKSSNPLDDIYCTEGILLDNNEDMVYRSLNEVLDEMIDLVINKDFTYPTRDCICKVYDYFLSDFFNK